MRYFIVFYYGKTIRNEISFGNTQVGIKADFVNRNFLNKKLEKESQLKDVIVTNFIEVSEREAAIWVAEEDDLDKMMNDEID